MRRRAAAAAAAGASYVRRRGGRALPSAGVTARARAAVQRDGRRRRPAGLRAAHARAEDPRRRSVAETRARAARAGPSVATAAPNTIARARAFHPDDPGTAGTPGGWQQMQWNFLPGIGVNAPEAWEHLIDVGRPGRRAA